MTSPEEFRSIPELSEALHTFANQPYIHARLDEALYRLDVEPEGHGYRGVAEEELADIKGLADVSGLSQEDFEELCSWVRNNPWIGEDGEPYIGTDKGKERYSDRPEIIIGQGQLPPGEASLRLLGWRGEQQN